MDQIETSLSTLQAVLPQVHLAVLDFETSDVKPHVADPCGLGVYLPTLDRFWYVNVGHTRENAQFPKYPAADLAAVLTPFLAATNNRIIVHNATYELRILMRMGIIAACRVSDTYINSHRCDENLVEMQGVSKPFLRRVSYGLKELTQIYYDEEPLTLHEVIGKRNVLFSPIAEVAQYCAFDCTNTWRLYQRAEAIFADDLRLVPLVAQIDDPNHIVISKMLWRGVRLDVDEARNQSAQCGVSIQACNNWIWTQLGINWPLRTPSDIRRVLRHLHLQPDLGFDPFSLPIETWESEPSIASEILTSIINECADPLKCTIIAVILWKYRMSQRRSAFLDPAAQHVFTDGRLHCQRFSSTLVTTRFSCSPNVQNLPGRADADESDDPDHWENLVPPDCHVNLTTRNIFVAEPGHMLVSMDLSAAEPRYLGLLFENALHEKDANYQERRTALHALRWSRYPALMLEMRDTQVHDDDYEEPVPIEWPTYAHDPLWQVFASGNDPYNALMQAMCPEEHAAAVAQGLVDQWFLDNRWRSKLAFLALGYGASAETLAPQLNWTEQQTTDAMENLTETYQTLKPLKELTLLEVLHLGEVRSLWGRPRRLNGFYQLARPYPLTVRFYRMKPTHREYEARIIPLGTTRNGVQCLVEECAIVRDDDSREIVLSCDHDADGTHNVHTYTHDTFVGSPHFNTVPFRNINYAQTRWVRDEHGLLRPLEKQSRVLRQAFNAKCQMTGADHIRWLMNRIDQQVIPQFPECHLVLTIHDSLIYEVPESQLLPFIQAAYPMMTTRPDWSNIDFRVKVEYGQRFGDLVTWHPPQ